jgi:hypothetical protein
MVAEHFNLTPADIARFPSTDEAVRPPFNG